MDNELKILISASLNLQKSASNINEQLAELATKLQSIKLNVNIDGKALETLTASFSKFGNEQLKINKIIDQTSKTSGEALSDLNARVKQIQESSDEYAKVTIKTFKNTQNLKSATIEYRDELGKLVKEEMAWTTAVSKNKDTGKPEKNKIFQTTGFTFVEDFAKEAKATEQAAQQMDNALRDIGKKRTQAELADIALRQEAAYKAKEAEVASAEKAEKVQEDLAHKLQLFQMNSAASVESLNKRRGDNVDVAALSMYQAKVSQLTSETPNLTRQMQLLDAEFKKITVDSQRTGETARQSGTYITQMLERAAMQAVVFRTIYSAENFISEALKTGFVDIESKMAGYVQTNELYFTSIKQMADGTEIIVPITDRINTATEGFIKTTHDLGASIDDVLESARLWGRMYKDVNIVQEMVRQSTKLSTIDLVSLADATKMMESTLAQYGVQINNVNDAQVIGGRVLDSWTSVAHATMAPARDLGAAFERTGKIASEMGVSFDFMNGLISAGIRNTALSGENLGRQNCPLAA